MESPVASLFRTIFDRRLRIGLGVQIVAVAYTASLSVFPTHAFDYSKVIPEQVAEQSVEISTESSYKYPVVAPTGVSQYYHGIHRGIDIRAPKGTGVVSIASGTVVEVRHDIFGYGNHVRIAHDGTMSTLYAHLDEIEVSVGERVEQGQEIGTVGTTGWATGPHLHFEIMEGMSNVNPVSYVSANQRIGEVR